MTEGKSKSEKEEERQKQERPSRYKREGEQEYARKTKGILGEKREKK